MSRDGALLVEEWRATPARRGVVRLHRNARDHGASAALWADVGDRVALRFFMTMRRAGHDGAWGQQGYVEVSMKIGRPVFRRDVPEDYGYIGSDCPILSALIRRRMGVGVENAMP